MELTVATRDGPRSSRHLISCLSVYLNDIKSVLATIVILPNHDRLDSDAGATVETVVTFLDYVLLPLKLFSPNLSLQACFGLSKNT